MDTKLEYIMMIDDDPATNYLHQLIVKKSNLFEKQETFSSAQEALDHINEINNTTKAFPEIILLDINMPAINGWEFIEQFENMKKVMSLHTIIVMLTTSINPKDKIKSLTYESVKKFENKPLSVEKLIDIKNIFIQ